MLDRQYRPEIDGLRALSVVGVLLFHVGLGLPGGFVGVDVFLVISGYLITGIILRQLRDGTFSLADFWVRRIRRILPASSVMVLVTLAAGALLLTPLAYKDLAETALAQALVVSNYVFARQDGYFAEGAEFSPLLHTWSLAVEEQFYILFPLLLVVAWQRTRAGLIGGLVTLATASFAWSCFSVGGAHKAAFFLLPSRAWELLAGGLLALQGHRRPAPAVAELLSGAGLVMVLVAMFAYHRLTPFPGAHALLPVLGAGMFIFGNQGRKTFAGRMLARRPVVFIGLISYSLYLWHWPLLVLAKSCTIDLGLASKWLLLAASLLLGTLSWRFVERPFRRADGPLQRRSVAFTFAAASLVITVALSTVIWRSGGLAGRLAEQTRLLLEDVDWRGEEYVREDGAPVAIGAGDGAMAFVLWGDSHGMAMASAVDAMAAKNGCRGEAVLSAGVAPVTGLWFPGLTEGERSALLEKNERVVARIIRDRVPNVILAGRWIARCEGYDDAEMVDQQPGFRSSPMVIDEIGQAASPPISSLALGRQLAGMLTRLHAAGIKVWLIRQVPETDHRDTAKRVAMLKRFPAINQLGAFTTTREQHASRRATADRAFASIPPGLVEIIDPSEPFFRENGRVRIYAERAFYRDNDHLTRPGAEYYLSPSLEAIFSQIRRAASPPPPGE